MGEVYELPTAGITVTADGKPIVTTPLGNAGYGPFSPYTNVRSSVPTEKAPEPPAPYDVSTSNLAGFLGALGGGVGAGISGGSRAGYQSLTSGMSGWAANAAAKGAGPLFGGLLGPITGGAVQLLLSTVFGLNKPQAIEHEEPIPVKITNVVEFMRMFILPQSAYFSPTGLNTNPLQLAQANTFNFNNPGPKTAGRVVGAITDGTLANQLGREFS